MAFHVDISAEPRVHESDRRLARYPLVGQLLEQARRDLDHDLDAVRDSISRVAILLDGIASDRAHGRPAPAPLPRLSPWRVRDLEALIASDIDKAIRVDVMARRLGMSTSLFSRACKNTFGVPPHGLLIRRRLERSQQMMLSHREPLIEIALACGFADQAHFSRLFRKTIGLPPGRWRQMQGASA